MATLKLRRRLAAVQREAERLADAGCVRCQGRHGHVWWEGAEAPRPELHRCAGCGRALTVHRWIDVPATPADGERAPTCA